MNTRFTKAHELLLGNCFWREGLEAGLAAEGGRGLIVAKLFGMNHKDTFIKNVRALNQFRLREGHCKVPATHIEMYEFDPVRLGNWVNYTRGRHRKNELPSERVCALEMTPKWEWGPLRRGPHRKLERDAEILTARRGGQTMPQIARRYGLSRQRIHQIVTAGTSV